MRRLRGFVDGFIIAISLVTILLWKGLIEYEENHNKEKVDYNVKRR